MSDVGTKPKFNARYFFHSISCLLILLSISKNNRTSWWRRLLRLLLLEKSQVGSSLRSRWRLLLLESQVWRFKNYICGTITKNTSRTFCNSIWYQKGTRAAITGQGNLCRKILCKRALKQYFCFEKRCKILPLIFTKQFALFLILKLYAIAYFI